MHENGAVRGTPVPGGRRAAQKAATREALREAGRSRFLRSGYSAARIEDIAADAGASPATFYLHFPTKRDLVLDLIAEVEQEASVRYPLLRDVVAARSKTAIAEWLTGTFAGWPVMAPLVRAGEQAEAVDDTVRSSRLDVYALGVDVVTQGLVDAYAMPEVEARTRASLTLSLHHGVFRDYQRGVVTDLAGAAPVLSAMWFTALHGPA